MCITAAGRAFLKEHARCHGNEFPDREGIVNGGERIKAVIREVNWGSGLLPRFNRGELQFRSPEG
jgi:hypothetical protein